MLGSKVGITQGMQPGTCVMFVLELIFENSHIVTP